MWLCVSGSTGRSVARRLTSCSARGTAVTSSARVTGLPTPSRWPSGLTPHFNNTFSTRLRLLLTRHVGNVLFNNALNTFFYGYMASDIW